MDCLPEVNVSWYDAIYFCNKLSEKLGLVPVYSVNNRTNVSKWNYIPHEGNSIGGTIKQNESANGFRLPTQDEWIYAAKGGEENEFAGSDDIDEVGWYEENSGARVHPIAQKKANGYGLYDMSGNVMEWCWDSCNSYRVLRGGCWHRSEDFSKIGHQHSIYPYGQFTNVGFRVVRSE